jgi:acetyltransferase-like isoleucine patch superfamily enzyme
MARKLYWGVGTFALPAPKLITRPMLWCLLTVRKAYYWMKRVFICDPLFKAQCKEYGRGVRSGEFLHLVAGKGDVILGDFVLVDGKCSFAFSSRYCDTPVLKIGDRSRIGTGCSFVVGKCISIGRDCLIAAGVAIFDSNGHPTDPQSRLAGLPPPAEEVRPIEIGDNVWIGSRSMIFPGVKIGEGSIVSANSVVRSNVRPYTVVAGNPARKVADLPQPAQNGSSPADRDQRFRVNGSEVRSMTTTPVTTGEIHDPQRSSAQVPE